MKWDVFISHASEDKNDVAIPLANILNDLGVRVWFDKFTMKVGDSLTKSIDIGLSRCKYGIVVLSKDFFNKGYPDYELRGLLSREIGSKKVILPIWHNVEKKDINKFSPSIADKMALETAKCSIEEIAFSLLEVIRPDIFENITRKIAFNNIVKSLPKAKVHNDLILTDRPNRHENLSLELLLQLRIIQLITSDLVPFSFEQTVNNFKKDVHPEREVMVWNRMVATYLEFIKGKKYNLESRREIFCVILKISWGPFFNNNYSECKYINLSDIRQIETIYNTIVPGVSYFNTDIIAELKTKDKRLKNKSLKE